MLRSFWLISLILLRYSQSSNVDLYFQIQPQLVRVNNLNEMYITNDEHFLGQVLYRYDQIQLACDCQTTMTRIQWEMHWSMNNERLYQPKNSTSIQLSVNAETMQAPVTTVTCHCTFTQKNSTKVQRSYQYQLYIGREIFFEWLDVGMETSLDLESEPTLETIHYIVPFNVFKRRFNQFRRHPHFFIIFGLLFVVLATLCSLLTVKISSYYRI